MKWSKLIAASAVMAGIFAVLPARKAAAQGKAQLSDERFKNIKVLKGIPLDDFMGTMGVMTSSLAFDCSDCHTGAGTDTVDWAADTPRKVTARRMVTMVGEINKNYFRGRQVVTCYSCHHGRDKPATTNSIENVYGPPPTDQDDAFGQAEGQPPAEQILDHYLKALGGEQKVAAIKSWVAKGESVGFGGLGNEAIVTLSAKFPDQRTLKIDYANAPGRGDTTRAYDGKVGLLRTPMNVLGEFELSGGELDGTRLDALMSFPGQIKQVLKNLRVGLPATISDLPAPESQASKAQNVGIGQDKLVDVVQGDGDNGMLVTMYFDHESGLLLRTARYAKSQIGRVLTQVDTTDYRDVNGVKFPFRITFAWFNGRDAIRLNDIKTNVAIDPAVFGKPAPLKSSGAN